MDLPPLGQVMSSFEFRRDAIHIAIAPVTATTELQPGQHVGLADAQHAGPSEKPVGIVDPFLTAPVQPGQRFWLLLYPGTITDLRHVWRHPAFATAPVSGRDGSQ